MKRLSKVGGFSLPSGVFGGSIFFGAAERVGTCVSCAGLIEVGSFGGADGNGDGEGVAAGG